MKKIGKIDAVGVAVSDNEEGTGEVTERCSLHPNPLNIPLHSYTALDHANKVPVSQNKIVAASPVRAIY